VAAEARDRLDQLRLPVPLHARHRDDLARVDHEVQVPDRRVAAVVVTVRPEISSTGAPGIAGSLATSRATVRPTIISASDSCVASAGVVDPTTRPRRSTVIRSEISRTSLSLWVMKMIEVPPACSERMISNSSSVSWGVSTADGSSRIRRLDWRRAS